METVGQVSSTNSYVDTRPVTSLDDQEATQVATSPADDMQLRKPTEAGRIPAKKDAESSKVQIDGRTYSERVWKGDIDGH